MIVQTQSREGIAEIVHAYISEMVGASDYYVFGTCAGHGVFSGSKLTLGIYKSKKDALKQIEKMTDFFANHPGGVYRME